ncbi:MAG: GNAT family N-acetyltransferase [Rikenellaceae bacterium]|nr:GNAT family N-acetyltransferase [Rikenellaceae bacterium]
MKNYLESEKIRLRVLEPEDVEILYRWENDTAVWGVSHTLLPFSRHILRQFIEEQSKEIYQTGQVRFVMESRSDGRPVGVIDLFDFDPCHLRAGVGILVYEPGDCRKGYAAEALALLIRYAFGILHLHQLFCHIPATNIASQQLFQRAGFECCGQKKEWLRKERGWEDEYMYQLFQGK